MDPKTAPSRAKHTQSIKELDTLIESCRACPRLVAWREEVGRTKRAAFADETYWAKPVPSFGPGDASILIVGLAPAAHGANRTGRMFTGDKSGDFLYASLFRVGLANQPHAEKIDDGLKLFNTRIASPVRCAPPKNMPTAKERNTCSPYLEREIELMSENLKVFVVLGGFGWNATLNVLTNDGWEVPKPKPVFKHNSVIEVHHPDGHSLKLLACYHVSQHNTFTGRLTPEILDETLTLAKGLAERN